MRSPELPAGFLGGEQGFKKKKKQKEKKKCDPSGLFHSVSHFFAHFPSIRPIFLSACCVFDTMLESRNKQDEAPSLWSLPFLIGDTDMWLLK